MKVSQLSAETGVPLPTIKMYLRKGLLQPGDKTEPNQAEYGEEHARRLRLIHGLLHVGGLSIATARKVLDAAGSDLPLINVLGVAQRAATDAVDDSHVSPHAQATVDELVGTWGGGADPRDPGRTLAATAIDAFEQAGQRDASAWYERYAALALLIAEADLDLLDASEGSAAKAETVVLGTVLGDTLLAGLRRSAQWHLSEQRYLTPESTRPPSSDSPQNASRS